MAYLLLTFRCNGRYSEVVIFWPLDIFITIKRSLSFNNNRSVFMTSMRLYKNHNTELSTIIFFFFFIENFISLSHLIQIDLTARSYSSRICKLSAVNQ